MSSVLSDKLKEREYYESKVPMYLQQSEGFMEHFKIWYDVLLTSCNTADEILEQLDIYSPNFTPKSDMLEKLCSIFNVTRYFTAKVNDVDTYFSLSDAELLMLLKAQIIKNYADGSYEQMKNYYNDNGLSVYFIDKSSASVEVYLVTNLANDSNIVNMFKAGLLTVESMGITYTFSSVTTDSLIWALTGQSNDYNLWHNGTKGGKWV